MNQGRTGRVLRLLVPTAAATACALALAAGPAAASGSGPSNHGGGGSGGSGGGSSTNFTVSLATTTVAVDNWSSYTPSQLTPLIQYADRGMATTNPLHRNVAGEMENGDRVVVTQYGIYWLDIVRRGGLLSGIWPIVSTSSGPNFQYMPSGDEWEPNSLLPGAAANSSAIYDAGQSVLVLATGTDAGCTPGKGTFVIGNSDNCGIADGPAGSTFTTSTSTSGDHYYTFTGTLYQEGTAHDTWMIDASGQTAQMAYNLTYDFRGYLDTTLDYGADNGPADQRVLTSVTLTPSASIDLITLVVGIDSDQGGAPYPARSYDYASAARALYYDNTTTPCGPISLSAYQVGAICEGSSATTQWLTEQNKLPATVSQGDFVTEKQTATVGDTSDRELTVLFPSSTSTYLLPERVDHIWNQTLDVSSLSPDYFNGETVSVAGGSPIHFEFDTQTVPHP